jgi:phosphotransferase system enzyme I (PtsI)
MTAWSLSGIGVGDALAIGRAWVLAPARLDLPRRHLVEGQVEAEVARFQAAVAQVQAELEGLRQALGDEPAAELRAFLDLQSIVMHDPLLIDETELRIRQELCNAEWALVQQLEAVSLQFDEIEDAYLRERKADVQQLVDRILKAMQGTDGLAALFEKEAADPSQPPWILVARDIAPADMLILRQHSFAGFATDSGSATSHTAILARSLGLPAVVGVPGLHDQVDQGAVLVLDAENGMVVGALDETALSRYQDRQTHQIFVRQQLEAIRHLESITRDGQRVLLMANIDLPEDAAMALARGCEGVGLLRSEFLFMNRASMPSEEEQLAAYKTAVLAMSGRVVTIRTLDSGADKDVPALQASRARPANPALALRAIRLCLAEPEIFLTQVRAILRASAFGPVKVLVPLVSGPAEIIAARELIAKAMSELRAKGQSFDARVPIGAMIEVPSAAIAIDGLLAHIDFASLGTNDLIQYTLAIDRTDSEVAHLYDPLHPAVIRLIQNTLTACRRAGTPVSLCGEMAGDPRFTRILIGLGLREFSMHSAEILRVKQEVLDCDALALARPARRLTRLGDPATLRAAVTQLNQHGSPAQTARLPPGP